MIEMLVIYFEEVFMFVGGCMLLIGAIGALRFPEFYTRVHAAGLMDTGGLGLIFLGLFLEAGFTEPEIKLILISLLLYFTSPTSAHALAKAAMHGRIPIELEKKENKS